MGPERNLIAIILGAASLKKGIMGKKNLCQWEGDKKEAQIFNLFLKKRGASSHGRC
jgi:hypothetical protein